MKDRALVLGGGGVAGIAWMTGLIFGLSERGVDLRTADMMVGTSAGSAVAAQLGSRLSLRQLFDRQVDPAQQVREITPDPHLLELFRLSLLTATALSDPAERTRRVGQWALKAPIVVREQERRSVIAERLPSHSWPDVLLLIAAVNAETGELKIFDRFSETNLVDAVGASCAVPGIWPPVTIDGQRYMDGGTRSSDNADLAKGYARTIIVSPAGDTLPEMAGGNLEAQIGVLKAAGGEAYVVQPDNASKIAMGADPLSPETRIPAAEGGCRQGKVISEDVARFWGCALRG
jgi:NTE family protein